MGSPPVKKIIVAVLIVMVGAVACGPSTTPVPGAKNDLSFTCDGHIGIYKLATNEGYNANHYTMVPHDPACETHNGTTTTTR